MKEKEILKKTSKMRYYSPAEEPGKMNKEEMELYLFLCGGFSAK